MDIPPATENLRGGIDSGLTGSFEHRRGLCSQVSRMIRHVSNISRMRAFTGFPYGIIKVTIGGFTML